MNPPRIVPFAHDYLEAAAQLVAMRQVRLRAAERSLRGFQIVYLRLRREIDPRLAWANGRVVDPGAGPR